MSKAESKLSHEDRCRLTRLYEEVVGRMQEATMIVGRTLGKSGETRVGAAAVTMGLPLLAPPAVQVRGDDNTGKDAKALVKILCVQGFCFLDEHGNCVGVEDEQAGVCRPC